MPDPVTGILGGVGVLSAGATVYASGKAEDAAETQAAASIEGADAATAANLKMYYDQKKTLAPWVTFGEERLKDAENLLAQGRGEFVFDPETEPGYKFGYEEFVEKPLLRGASAEGYLGGGRTGKELTRYASDYASGKYRQARQDWLSEWDQKLNQFYIGAGLGQVASERTAQSALATGQNVGQLTAQGITGAANARATGYVNQANIYGNLAGGVGQNLLDYYYMQNQPVGREASYTQTLTG